MVGCELFGLMVIRWLIVVVYVMCFLLIRIVWCVIVVVLVVLVIELFGLLLYVIGLKNGWLWLWFSVIGLMVGGMLCELWLL